MAPVEARYTVNGAEKVKVTAEDGVSVVLNTPVGIARAELDPRKGNFFDGTLGERFETQFPKQSAYREFISIFDIPRSIRYKQEKNQPALVRSKEYQTNKGRLVIELKAVNTDPSKASK